MYELRVRGDGCADIHFKGQFQLRVAEPDAAALVLRLGAAEPASEAYQRRLAEFCAGAFAGVRRVNVTGAADPCVGPRASGVGGAAASAGEAKQGALL